MSVPAMTEWTDVRRQLVHDLLLKPRRVLLTEVPGTAQPILHMAAEILLADGPVQVIDAPSNRDAWYRALNGATGLFGDVGHFEYMTPARLAAGAVELNPDRHIVCDAEALTLNADTVQWSILAPILRRAESVHMAVRTARMPKAIHQIELVDHMDKAVLLLRDHLSDMFELPTLAR